MRQEQEPAGTDVTEVGPGVLRMQLPIQMPGLGHVNMYALQDDRGVAIVDPGLPGPSTWKGIQDRFKAAGIKNSDVHTILVTHSHPDHFGSAGHWPTSRGADIVTHADVPHVATQPHPHRRQGRQPGGRDHAGHAHADAAIHVDAEDLATPPVGRLDRSPWVGPRRGAASLRARHSSVA